jgi:hypothetical protein
MLYFLVDKELRDLRDRIVEDYKKFPIRDLCTKRSEGYDMKFFKLDDKFYEMASKITEIQRSQIFDKLWQKYGEKLKTEVTVVKMEDIFKKIWSIILDKLKSINEQFLDGEMQLKEVDTYLDMCKTDYDVLEKELMLISTYFNGTAHLVEVKKKLGISIKKVKSYKEIFDVQQAALEILKLKEVMGLKGNFSEVEKIKEVRLYTFCCLTVSSAQGFRKMFGLSQNIWAFSTLNLPRYQLCFRSLRLLWYI